MEAVLNHLWQSTVFAGVAWLLTLALQRNRAQTRYWVWFAASMKFLVPFAMLAAAGSQVSWRHEATVSAPARLSTVMEQAGQPFEPATPVAVPKVDLAPGLLLLVWAIGFITIVTRWGHRWTQMNKDMHKARPIELGLPVPVRCSAALREPGVFGVLRPVLLLPEGITDRMTGAQLEAILAHELCHVRRRDNLMTAMHMVVEAVFWFHPLVWWIGARLMEERERTCDEEVLRGNDAQTYAEGILKVCEFYLKSQLECVAGVAGANLNKRIEEIMANRIGRGLSVGKKMLLAAAGTLAVAGPVAIGVVNAPPIRAQAPAEPQSLRSVEFEVASVKPVATLDGNLTFPGLVSGERFASRAPIATVIAHAYSLPINAVKFRLTGPADWDRLIPVYDIEATGVFPAELTDKDRTDRARLMLQALLADRFKLKIHVESKETPVYALVTGKGGPKLQKAGIEEKDCPIGMSPPALGAPVTACHIINGGRGRGMHARAADMSDVVTFVENWTDRPLVDKTGIKGLYRIDTSGWLPMEFGLSPPPGAKQDGVDVGDLPTIFELFEKLGLKMESTKDKVDVYVVDHIEKPTEN
jgi:bla regulator protein BlaR1